MLSIFRNDVTSFRAWGLSEETSLLRHQQNQPNVGSMGLPKAAIMFKINCVGPVSHKKEKHSISVHCRLFSVQVVSVQSDLSMSPLTGRKWHVVLEVTVETVSLKEEPLSWKLKEIFFLYALNFHHHNSIQYITLYSYIFIIFQVCLSLEKETTLLRMTVWTCVTLIPTVLQFCTVLLSLIVFCSQRHLSALQIQSWTVTPCAWRQR